MKQKIQLQIPKLNIINSENKFDLNYFYNLFSHRKDAIKINVIYFSDKDYDIFVKKFINYYRTKFNIELNKKSIFLNITTSDDLKNIFSKFYKDVIFILIPKDLYYLITNIEKTIYFYENPCQYILVDMDKFSIDNSKNILFPYIYLLMIKTKINFWNFEEYQEIMEIAFFFDIKNDQIIQIYSASTYCDNKFLFYTQTIESNTRIDFFVILFKALNKYCENIKSNPKKISIYANQEIKSYQIDNLSEKIIKSWKQIFQKNINEDIKIYIIYYETQTYSLNNGDLFGNYEIIEKDENSIRIKMNYYNCCNYFIISSSYEKEIIQFLFNSSLKTIFLSEKLQFPYAIYNVIQYYQFIKNLNLVNGIKEKNASLPFYLSK